MLVQIYLELCNHKTQKRYFSIGYKKSSILIQSPWELAGKNPAMSCKKHENRQAEPQYVSKHDAGTAEEWSCISWIERTRRCRECVYVSVTEFGL